jgi:ankyrin repeat protein
LWINGSEGHALAEEYVLRKAREGDSIWDFLCISGSCLCDRVLTSNAKWGVLFHIYIQLTASLGRLVHNEEYGGGLEVIARSTPLGTLLTQWLHNPAHFEEIVLVERELRKPFNSLEKTKEQKAEYLFFLFQILWKQESLRMNLTQDSHSVWPTIEKLLSPLSPPETKIDFSLPRHSYENRNQRTLLHFAAMKSSNLTAQLFCSSSSSSSRWSTGDQVRIVKEGQHSFTQANWGLPVLWWRIVVGTSTTGIVPRSPSSLSRRNASKNYDDLRMKKSKENFSSFGRPRGRRWWWRRRRSAGGKWY